MFVHFLISQQMVQAGVNAFPAGAGFTPSPATMNAAESGLPVAVSMKNDSLASSLKDSTVPPTLTVPQVRLPSNDCPHQFSSKTQIKFFFSFLQAFQPPGGQFSPPILPAQPQTSGPASLPLPLPVVSIANAIEQQTVRIYYFSCSIHSIQPNE